MEKESIEDTREFVRLAIRKLKPILTAKEYPRDRKHRKFLYNAYFELIQVDQFLTSAIEETE